MAFGSMMESPQISFHLNRSWVLMSWVSNRIRDLDNRCILSKTNLLNADHKKEKIMNSWRSFKQRLGLDYLFVTYQIIIKGISGITNYSLWERVFLENKLFSFPFFGFKPLSVTLFSCLLSRIKVHIFFLLVVSKPVFIWQRL